MTPGRLIYLGFHQPVGAIKRSFAQGGPWVQWQNYRGEQAMRAATRRLDPPLGGSDTHDSPHKTPVHEVHLLTGTRFWHQTAFCLWSFARHADCRLAPILYDDGTLTLTQCTDLRRLFPLARFQSHGESLERVDRLLPASRFPSLYERWNNYPHIRKLINPHLGESGAKLVMDSDLLFFRRPEFVLAWLSRPESPLHAVDIITSYGYPIDELSRLAGAALAPLVNVGLTGLRSEEIDWEKLEHWTASLIQRHGTRYVLEQALVAMLVAGRECAVAPAGDYVTCPRPPEATSCQAVMHHYVAESKRWYFQKNWRRVLAA